jgi:hypothetical protein
LDKTSPRGTTTSPREQQQSPRTLQRSPRGFPQGERASLANIETQQPKEYHAPTTSNQIGFTPSIHLKDQATRAPSRPESKELQPQSSKFGARPESKELQGKAPVRPESKGYLTRSNPDNPRLTSSQQLPQLQKRELPPRDMTVTSTLNINLSLKGVTFTLYDDT